LLQIGKVLHDKLTEGACCLREIMLLMPGYAKGPLTGGIRQVKCSEVLLVDLFLHQRRCESYTQMGFDDIGMVVADLFARPDTSIGKTLEIAGDELTNLQMAEIYTKVTGQPARFEEQPIEEVRAFNPDFAAMLTWQNDHSFGADIVQLRAAYPLLTTFEAWLAQHRLAVMPQEEIGG
jgi:hypothetical protein